MRKIFFMMAILFICGLLSADICISALKNEAVLLDIEVYRQYAYAKLVFNDIFWNIVYERGKLLILFVLLSFTPLKEKIPMILASLFSFFWGFFFMSCIRILGIAGIVVAIFSVIPHGLLYMGVLANLFRNSQVRSFRQRDRVVMGTATYILTILLFVTGCILETIVGTHFIPWVVRLSFI